MEVLPINNNSVEFKNKNDVNYNFYEVSEDLEDSSTISALSDRLGEELRAAKGTHLSCGEVLLPCDLLPRIARDILEKADSEPYGLRGCTLYLSFEGAEECRKLCTIKCDPTTTSTFEVFLTLKQSTTGWNFLPQFIKKITRGGTIMISPNYDLTKKKLYRSFSE
ncbi:protein scylla-like [Onthophagus taurus]|uniref:protein scylla-like n=1 Tax=Onthophagus taurus TaxID=166361 RepID=UPI000C2064E9|nr:protein scylla-like [Onthophagus taurus]